MINISIADLNSSEKRTLLRALLFDFQSRNAVYDDGEWQAVGSCLQVLQPVCQKFEAYNKATPTHGQPCPDTFFPPKYGPEVLEIDEYGEVTKQI